MFFLALRCSFLLSGFVPNQCGFLVSVLFGYKIAIDNNVLSITSSRITSILDKIEFLTNKIYISAGEISELAGKIISTKFVIGNITHLKTRNIYKIIESRPSWNN